MGELGKKVVRGAGWVTLEQLCMQGINFLLGVVLARLLTPDDYGTVALVTIFVAIAQVIVNSGLGQALIQKKTIDELDINSVFYASFALALVLYCVLWVAAPFIADYYRAAVLTPALRVLAVNLFLFSVNSVQNAEIYKEMRFDLAFRISVATTVVSGGVGVSMAFAGYGVWALVCSSVSGALTGVVTRAYYVSWRPRWMFSWARLRPLFHFGSRMMVNALLASVYNNLYGVIIGRHYTRADLAYVNKGRNIPDLLQGNINVSLIEVAFPALVQLQDDKPRLKKAMRRLLQVATLVVFPLLTILAIVASRVIVFLYGDSWAPCIPYMQLACLMMLWGPLDAVNNQAILAIGRSDVILKLGILNNVVSLAVLFSCLTQSVLLWVAVATLVSGPTSFVTAYVGSRLIGYRVREQVRDILPTFLACVAMAIPAFAVGRLMTSASMPGLFLIMVLQGLVALVVFGALVLGFRIRAVQEVVTIVRPRVPRRLMRVHRLMDYVCREEESVCP